MRYASTILQMDSQPHLTGQFHFHDVGKLNLTLRHEYQRLHLNKHVPSLNIRYANLVVQRPMVLAMMVHQILRLSTKQNLVDFS